MERISVFDMLKIGVGPSSSHTMGPWQAALYFLDKLDAQQHNIQSLTVDLYGSLAKTGRGHGTDIAVMMGLRGDNPRTCDVSQITANIDAIYATNTLNLNRKYSITFIPQLDIVYHFDESLPFHPNGLRFTAKYQDSSTLSAEYYSVGGGFVVEAGEDTSQNTVQLPYPCDKSADLLAHCTQNDLHIWEMVWANEQVWREPEQIHTQLQRIWETMLASMYDGCHTTGTLPGGLNVKRRAYDLHKSLIGDASYSNTTEWIQAIRSHRNTFEEVLRWVSCFALAVNEQNAAFGRVVTAPTNGAAGVLPAVLMYFVCFHGADEQAIHRFLMVAGEVGTFFKKGATISAAQGGCQAEIGVSSAMAAAALTEALGGTIAQALMAAEIAIEHHLGMTCDPIGGLVQVPCIERNAMGAMKAITAANLAVQSQPQNAKVSLDDAILVMWETAKDMSDKYKETSEGGLSKYIAVNVIEC
jgi:L-serine dehydratase